MDKKKAIVIGSGIAGIATAIRLAKKGYSVKIFEKNAIPGGKMGELKMEGFRFDTGPSLFTLPELVGDLLENNNNKDVQRFKYSKIPVSCKYFWNDGAIFNAYQDLKDFSKEVYNVFGQNEKNILKYFAQNKELYELTKPVFIFNSFNKWRNYFKKTHLRLFIQLYKLNAHTSMHKQNHRTFKHPKLVQVFDRYATYNGSNPYKAPATLNMISHLEHNLGAFFPEKGMYSIIEALVNTARELGVEFSFNSPIQRIIFDGKIAKAVCINDELHEADLFICNVDVVHAYKNLLPQRIPSIQLKKQHSSSALIFYWGVKGIFSQLQLHNILFSDNYKEEFRHLFESKTISLDPTVYIFISSKHVKSDAPDGYENWFVMINAPENVGQDWGFLVKQARKAIIKKINEVLNIDIEKYILVERSANPITIEQATSSYHGSLYGLSSNTKFSAFLRHPNFKRKFPNLYFVGGSVHPGGGIPLCLASAIIVDKQISKHENIY